MFSILVSSDGTAWESGQRMRMDASADRFLTYSGDEQEGITITQPGTLKRLERISSLLMYEICVDGPTGGIVRVGQMKDVRLQDDAVTFRFTETGRLTRQRVLERRHRFQLDESETSRTHWAAKDGDIPQEVLSEIVATPQQYDIVLSFAGENRTYVDAVATYLEARGVVLFYDKNEMATLWGKDLNEHFDLVYRKLGRFCVMFISSYYADKIWTSHERKSALARAMEQRSEYILPARFDDTEIPGLRPTVGYVDVRNMPPENLGVLILQKLGRCVQ